MDAAAERREAMIAAAHGVWYLSISSADEQTLRQARSDFLKAVEHLDNAAKMEQEKGE